MHEGILQGIGDAAVQDAHRAACPVHSPPQERRDTFCRSRLQLMERGLQMEGAAMRLPITEPAFPRTSTAVSGFFFQGMKKLVEA